MMCWGAISLGSAAVHNFGGIVAARMLLGTVEAGFVSTDLLPVASVYLQARSFLPQSIT
jgi:hypothetical protein